MDSVSSVAGLVRFIVEESRAGRERPECLPDRIGKIIPMMTEVEEQRRGAWDRENPPSQEGVESPTHPLNPSGRGWSGGGAGIPVEVGDAGILGSDRALNCRRKERGQGGWKYD